MAVAGRRSLHGCWTCRLRKKKCDETRPACLVCVSLDLNCHAYGRKPEWMDRGLLQKDKAREVKQTVQTQAARKYRRQSLGVVTSSKPRSNPAFYDMEISPALSENLGDIDMLSDLSAFGLPLPNQTSYEGFGLDKIDTSPEKSSFASSPASRDWSAGTQSANDKTSYTSDGSPVREPVAISQDNNEESPEVNAHYGTPFDVFLSSNHAYTQVSTAGDEHAEEDASVGSNIPSPSCPINPTLSFENAWCYKARPSSLPGPVAIEEMEDALLMHYLDEVFHILYPFYRCSGQGRGWLLTVLRRDRIACYATLALSGYHRYFNVSNYNTDTPSSVLFQTANTYYNLALHGTRLRIKESSAWGGTTALDSGTETLFAILQLLCWELFHGGTRNWQAYLQAANTLIPAIVNHLEQSSQSHRAETGYGPNYEKRLYSRYDSAIRFILGSFISMDIMLCASTRSNLSLDLDHKQVLERNEFSPEDLKGCSKAALILILEVSQLDTWKKRADQTRKLSLIELVRRGDQIERCCREELTRLESSTSAAVVLDHDAGMTTKSTEVSKIFTLAAITYLHIVISGANPELPEVQRGVADTMAAFQRLTDVKLLRNLIWPLCVTGSMALEGQYGFFLSLVATADATRTCFGTCIEALGIMEECWSTRKKTLDNCDWSSAMNTRDRFVMCL